MDKRRKKILLLSIFGGAAAFIVVGYFVFLVWVIAKAFPNNSFLDTASRFIDLVKCESQSLKPGSDPKCVQEWIAAQKDISTDKKREENPEYNACMYEQEVLLKALSASKVQGEALLLSQIAQFCDFQLNPSSAINNTTVYSGYTALKLLKNELASQAILNYRYNFFKKQNYPLELEALYVYRDLANTTKTCEALEKDIADLEKRGSVFVLGSKAICKLQECVNAKLTSCPEAVKIGKRMSSLGDIAGPFILMHEEALNEKQGVKALNYRHQALLKGYTDLASEAPELEEDFYKIKFTSESLAFNAARLMNAAKIYTPALNCVAASLNKDWEFETFRKSPKAFSAQQWSEKITAWANEDSDLLVRVACEVLTDVDSKKRLHEFYMNDGNEDGSKFDFCKMIQDPLFKDVCKEQ